MSELSFLIDLVLTEKLSKSVKDKIAERVKVVESMPPGAVVPRYSVPLPPNLPPEVAKQVAGQSPATIAAMLRHQQAAPDMTQSAPTAPITASLAAARAVEARDQAIAQGMSGKPEPGRTSPRKW